MRTETVTIQKEEYEDMKDYMERMRETIETLSSKITIKKLESALKRLSKGEFLTEEQVFQ